MPLQLSRITRLPNLLTRIHGQEKLQLKKRLHEMQVSATACGLCLNVLTW